MNAYREVFAALDKSKIDYLVVGGVAVNLYGYVRFTGDIDIMLALDEKNLKKMDKLMIDLGYIQRLPVSIQELGDKKKVKNWLKTKGMTAYTFLSEKQVRLDIDILVDKSLNFAKYNKKKHLMEIWDIKLPLVSLDDLIEMKKEAGRDKDLLDLKNLLELKSYEEDNGSKKR